MLAKLLTPNKYETIFLVLIFITIANVFVTDGFGTVLIQKEKADNINFSIIFYFDIAFSVVIYMEAILEYAE